jgi:SAM-dependent methyltransferase
METTNYLKSFFTEHWKYMAVSTACKLSIFDALQKKQTSQQLAISLSLNEQKATLLLEALVSVGFLKKQNDYFELNEISDYLTEQHPESLKYAAMNWSGEHLTAWQDLDYSIATGKSSFEHIYGCSFFDYLNEHPAKLHNYHKAMYEYARYDYKQLPELIDFGKHTSVMDVGGGYGAAIKHISKRYPNVKCILFDLVKVILSAETVDCFKISGNFFENIPSVSDALILSRILHDWNNDDANRILINCNKTLPENGTLYVIENCKGTTENDLSLLSLNMSVMCESYERTTEEYIDLCFRAGFAYQSQLKLNHLQTILIFKKS